MQTSTEVFIRANCPLSYLIFDAILSFCSLIVLKEVKCCLLLFVCLCTVSLLWVPLQFIFLRSCFASSTCTSQQLLLSYGCLFSAITLVIVRIFLFMQLMRAYRNFGYGLADSAFVGLVNETTRLLSRPQTRQQDL